MILVKIKTNKGIFVKYMPKQKTIKTDKIHRSKEAALPILATCPNYSEAARQIGVRPEQVYEWLKDPAFKAQLDKLRSEITAKAIDEAVLKLKNSMVKAVDTFIKLLEREDYPAVQRAAANDILSHIQKFKELQELEERITLLEQRSAA